MVGYFVPEFQGRHTRRGQSLPQVPATCHTNSYWFELKGQVVCRNRRLVSSLCADLYGKCLLSFLSFRFHKMLLYLGLSSSVAKNTKVTFQTFLPNVCKQRNTKVDSMACKMMPTGRRNVKVEASIHQRV